MTDHSMKALDDDPLHPPVLVETVDIDGEANEEPAVYREITLDGATTSVDDDSCQARTTIALTTPALTARALFQQPYRKRCMVALALLLAVVLALLLVLVRESDDTDDSQVVPKNPTLNGTVSHDFTVVAPEDNNDAGFGNYVHLNDGLLLVRGGPNRAYLYNATTGAQLQTLRFDPDFGIESQGLILNPGSVVLSNPHQSLVEGWPQNSGMISTFKTTTGLMVSTTTPQPVPNQKFGATMDTDGTHLVVTGGQQVFLFQAPSSSTLALQSMHTYDITSPNNQREEKKGLAIHNELFVVGDGKQAFLYATDSTEKLATLDPPNGNDQELFGTAVDLNDRLVVVAGTTTTTTTQERTRAVVYVYSRQGNLLRTIKVPSDAATGTIRQLQLALDDQNRVLVSFAGETETGDGHNTNGEVYLLDAAMGEVVQRIRSPTVNDMVYGYAIDMDNNQIVVSQLAENDTPGQVFVYSL